MTTLNIQHNVQLDARRCAKCHRWYASETYISWQCGECRAQRCEELDAEIATLKRSIAALRGARRKQ